MSGGSRSGTRGISCDPAAGYTDTSLFRPPCINETAGNTRITVGYGKDYFKLQGFNLLLPIAAWFLVELPNAACFMV